MAAFALRDYQEHFTVEGTSSLAGYRQRAFDDLAAQGLPGGKTEDWKYTNVRPLIAEELMPAPAATPVAVPDIQARHLAVMVNGFLNPDLSQLDKLPDGVRLSGLKRALEQEPEAVNGVLGQVVNHDCHPFAAYNGAFFEDGLWIDVAPGTILEDPIVVLWLTGAGEAALVQPRLLMRVGANAQASLCEQHHGGQTRVAHVNNQVSEIHLADNARLTHVQIQQTGAEKLICGTHVRCERDSYYRSQSVDLGGALVRNDLVVTLAAQGAEADADGVFLATRGDHVDNHVRIDHAAPHCASGALYKGILADRGRGVFNSKLIVHPEGHKTDARQVNHNLLLTDDIEIDTKPELEIYTDDVQCSHGSTTGELDENQLFYLLSRGVGKLEARTLLVGAFALAISERLPEGSLRTEVENRLQTALQQLTDERL